VTDLATQIFLVINKKTVFNSINLRF